MSAALQAIQEKIKADLAATKGAVPVVSGRRISIKGKVFFLPNGQSSPGPLEVVVLDFRNFNKFYPGAYNPQQVVAPACYAIGKTIEEMAPPEDLDTRVADLCNGCTNNKFGSASTGKGKACKNTVRVAVMAPDAKPDEDAMLINVSPTGIKSWAALVAGLEAQGLHTVQVVTSVSFNPDEAYPQLVFKAIRQFDNVETAWHLREKIQPALDAPPVDND